MCSKAKLFKLIISIVFIIGVVIGATPVYADESDQPFSVLLLGVDTGALGREDQGRSDVIMIMTVNPKEHQMSITSIPRDTFVSVPELDFQDKLNHAYAYGGSELSLKVVNAWLGSDIRYYMQVDFAGIERVVDAIGGIDVVPPTTFSISGFTFIEGEQMHLNGDMALAYARERYTSGGDYARQNRQREILQAIIQQLDKTDTVSDVQQLVPILLKNISTNVNVLTLVNLYQSQKNNIPSIETYQLEGDGTMIDGVYYDIPNDNAVAELKQRIE